MNFTKQYDNFHRNYSDNIDYDEPSNKFFYRGLDFPVKGKRVLDLGCGGGELLADLSSKGAECTGIDISGQFIQKAASKFSGIDFKQGDMSDLPFPENSFDVVLSKYALQSVSNLQKVWLETARVLKPKGIFYYLSKHPLRQFLEKVEDGGKDYFEQSLVKSQIFGGSITLLEPSHALAEYFSPIFFENFDLLGFIEGSDFPASQQIGDLFYPTFFVVKAKRR